MDKFLLFLGQEGEFNSFNIFGSSKQVVPFKEKLNNMRVLALDGNKKNGFCDVRVHTQD